MSAICIIYLHNLSSSSLVRIVAGPGMHEIDTLPFALLQGPTQTPIMLVRTSLKFCICVVRTCFGEFIQAV